MPREIEQRVYAGKGEAWLSEFPGQLDVMWLTQRRVVRRPLRDPGLRPR